MFCGRCYATGAPTSNNPPRLLDKRIGIHQAFKVRCAGLLTAPRSSPTWSCLSHIVVPVCTPLGAVPLIHTRRVAPIPNVLCEQISCRRRLKGYYSVALWVVAA